MRIWTWNYSHLELLYRERSIQLRTINTLSFKANRFLTSAHFLYGKPIHFAMFEMTVVIFKLSSFNDNSVIVINEN